MNTILFYPKNQIIKKHIKYILFIGNSECFNDHSLTVFPNLNHCLGLLQHSELNVINHSNLQIKPSNKEFHSYLTGIYHHPITFKYEGKIDEICIEFEPNGIEKLFGINASRHVFVNNVIENLLNLKFKELYNVAFNYKKPLLRGMMIEQFLLKSISSKIKSSIPSFLHIESKTNDDLQKELHLSKRSIHRLFKNNLGITPNTYLNIKRFRNLLELFGSDLSQSQIAYLLEFADQSHMIRDFRKNTNTTPKKFQQNSLCIENEIWCMLN